jgi:tetratricopeptide (TPR) repeat protein
MMIEEIEQLLSRGKLPQALSELERAWINNRTDGSVSYCNLLTDLAFHDLDFDKAVYWSAKALEIEPESVTALHHAALVAWNQGKPDLTLEWVRKCLSLQPRHRGALDLFLLIDPHHPVKRRPETLRKIDRLRKKKRHLSVGIHTRSDREKDPQMRLLWGDYWVKKELEKEHSRLGFDLSQRHPDINIHLFGSPSGSYDENSLNLVWLYSHPDQVTIDNLRQFDGLFCASSHFLPTLQAMGYLPTELMPACTAKTPVQVPIAHNVIFLGNARENRPDGRAIVGDLIQTGLDFKVWGNLWDNLLPEEHYGGRYWEYDRLEELYASARITLNDHSPDMEREGFVSNKVFDILAGGGFVISAKNKGLSPLFQDTVPEYESAPQLKERLTYYLSHPEERQRLMAKGQKIAGTHTYGERAMQLMKDLVI